MGNGWENNLFSTIFSLIHGEKRSTFLVVFSIFIWFFGKMEKDP